MKTRKALIHLLGYASALGGVNPECALGPVALQQAPDFRELVIQAAKEGREFRWGPMIKPSASLPEAKLDEIKRLCQELALATAELTRKKEFFMVSGGDHTSAIGTWSGVRTALDGPLGLLWVDAHMDSHTPETSLTGRIHGMPLASLLGYGDARFTQLLSPSPKLKPEHLCLIGVRSYEEEEAKFLERLKVRVYFMDEVKKRGLAVVFKEALSRVTQGTVGYGLSLDVDGVDPKEAPGVDVPEPEGLSAKELVEVLKLVAVDPRLLGAEIVEFNPHRDLNQLTEKLIVEFMKVLGSSHA